jgi:hypothetical protein
MGEQQSQKQGLKSSAQKEVSARNSYAPLPASNRVSGASGGAESKSESDQDLSLALEEKRARQERNK